MGKGYHYYQEGWEYNIDKWLSSQLKRFNFLNKIRIYIK